MKEQGTALVLSLLVVVCLSGLGLGLATASGAERTVAGHAHGAIDTMLAADAAVESVLGDVAAAPDWSTWLSGVTTSFRDTSLVVTTPAKARVDLAAITAELQSDGTYGTGANAPVWHLIAWGRLAARLGLPSDANLNYVAVWAADDPAETDGRPDLDANHILLLHGEAFGLGAGRCGVDVMIERTPAGPRVRSWRSR